MAVSIVKVEVSPDKSTAVAFVKSDRVGPDAITELQEMDAKRLAITEATGKIADPRCSGEPKIYPVDASGKMVEDPKTQRTDHYVAEIPLTKRLV